MCTSKSWLVVRLSCCIAIEDEPEYHKRKRKQNNQFAHHILKPNQAPNNQNTAQQWHI